MSVAVAPFMAMPMEAKISVPPGDACTYPPEKGAIRGDACQWALKWIRPGERWCRIFDEATCGYKCKACFEASRGRDA